MDKKRRRAPAAKSEPRKGQKAAAFEWNPEDDEEIVSSDDEVMESDEEGGRKASRRQIEEEEEEEETADEKRARLAKEYIQKIRGAVAPGPDGGDVDAVVTDRLRQDVLATRGDQHAAVAHQLDGITIGSEAVSVRRGHMLSATCVTLLDDDSAAFTASKDGSILRWDIATGAKLNLPRSKPRRPEQAGKAPPKASKGHSREVLCMASSSDGRFLAAGGRDNQVRIWDLRINTVVRSFSGHSDAVTCLAFRKNTRTLFSGSADRSIKIWNVDALAHMDTLFGHGSEVLSLDCLNRERVFSCGRDRTVRLWKIPEDTHLILRSHNTAQSMECVSFLDETWCVSGAQDGSLSLFHSSRKKPVVTHHNAHGTPISTDGVSPPSNNMWVSALAVLPNTDVVASGAGDGFVNIWRAAVPAGNPSGVGVAERASLTRVASVPVPGFVNGLAFSRSGKFVVAATGQEHRLGRWWRLKDGRNGLTTIQLPLAL